METEQGGVVEQVLQLLNDCSCGGIPTELVGPRTRGEPSHFHPRVPRAGASTGVTHLDPRPVPMEILTPDRVLSEVQFFRSPWGVGMGASGFSADGFGDGWAGSDGEGGGDGFCGRGSYVGGDGMDLAHDERVVDEYQQGDVLCLL